MLKVGKGNGPEWLMFQHDVRRQSSLCDYSTAVEEKVTQQEETVKLYPNPARNTVTIQFQNPNNESCTLTVYNVIGELVDRISDITGNEVNIKHDKYTSGNYFFKIENEDGYVYTGKFIVFE